jgi:acyl-coenzyme A thioesterase PaaI-like protein
MSDNLTPRQAAHAPEGFVMEPWERGFGRTTGPFYVKAGPDDGPGRMGFRVLEHHANGLNNCHGGMLVSFADMAWGHQLFRSRADTMWVTVRLMTDFLSGGQMGDWLEGDSEVLSEQGDLVTVRGRIWCGERTVMTGTAVYKALAARPEAASA